MLKHETLCNRACYTWLLLPKVSLFNCQKSFNCQLPMVFPFESSYTDICSFYLYIVKDCYCISGIYLVVGLTNKFF